MKWSPMQESIFDAVSRSSANLIIEAVAGSGKTTTIVEAMRFAPASKPLFVAFNKAIADQLAGRVPTGAYARTLNALGHACVSRLFPQAKLERWKVSNLVRREGVVDFDNIRTIASAISYAKNNALGISVEATYEWFYDLFAFGDRLIDGQDCERFARVALRTFNASIDCSDIFDFDDQVYQPILHEKNPYAGYDVIFVDEAQDLSPINHEGLVLASSAGSRIIAVGDRHQAIYGFRGAHNNSMELLADTFDMQALPLSVTYRCPTSVTREAQRFCPHIEARSDAPEGSVVTADTLPLVDEFRPDDLILCRNNAPLFSIALQFIKANIPIRLQTNLGLEVIALIKKLEGRTSADALSSLCAWRDEWLEKFEKGSRGQAEILDRFNCIEPFFLVNPLADKHIVIDKISAALDSKRGTVISTIHRAKGQEAPRVFFERPGLIGDEGQEPNLSYVAITRSQSDLIFRPDAEDEEGVHHTQVGR